MPSFSEVQKLKNKYADQFLKKANVVGVGVGKKIVGDQETDELSIKVYVKNWYLRFGEDLAAGDITDYLRYLP